MHGYSGPIKVSYGGTFTNIGKEFLKVAAEYDTTRVSCDDPYRKQDWSAQMWNGAASTPPRHGAGTQDTAPGK